MDAASDSVTKVVYREGIGSSIECGDQVTILYSGMWSSNEGADFGIQFYPTIGECIVSLCIGSDEDSPCKELETLLRECQGGMKEGESSGFTMPHSNANLFGYEVPGDADVTWFIRVESITRSE